MTRRILSAVTDLFFSTRITATASQVGVTVIACPPADVVARCLEEPPDLVVLDLHAAGDPLAIVRALKADAKTRAIEVLGFYSHVDGALRRAALEAGTDQVLPRSAFTTRLPELLAGRATRGYTSPPTADRGGPRPEESP
jgi:CheY-like chemotaxis protein